MTTLALVSTDATIDFMCWPAFDSPSVFASLLDAGKGGSYSIAPAIPAARVMQHYVPETNVVVTRWLGAAASAEVIDAMIVSADGASRLFRRVRATRGRVRFELRCSPRFDYARIVPTLTVDRGTVVFAGENVSALRLRGDVAFEDREQAAFAAFELNAGDCKDFVLEDGDAECVALDVLGERLEATVREWQAWAAKSTYRGRWREAVTRSALVLKLLTSNEHGSIVAAGTFGLPEAAAGDRNWDYRATWIRDASFTVYGLMRLGYVSEATAFTRWVADRAAQRNDGSLDVIYALDGRPESEERSLDHLEGYGGARPVRVGNAATRQLQLDIYGALLDSIYLSNKYGEAISHADWNGVRRAVDYVCANWRRPDAGIWESRGEPVEHVHSRLMCWVAVDRAIRLATKRSLNAPLDRWAQTRNAIDADIWESFWDADVGHFVRSKGSHDLDGAMLMMPLVRFVGATDPAWIATLDAIGTKLTDHALVKRYDGEDGLRGPEGSFAACGFWYVECLARAGRIEEARLNFERLLSYANHVGLYAEEFDATAAFLGNFPQALTHLALISAAFYLDRAIDRPAGNEWRA